MNIKTFHTSRGGSSATLTTFNERVSMSLVIETPLDSKCILVKAWIIPHSKITWLELRRRLERADGFDDIGALLYDCDLSRSIMTAEALA